VLPKHAGAELQILRRHPTTEELREASHLLLQQRDAHRQSVRAIAHVELTELGAILVDLVR
jgi:hypothetical protein